MKTLTAVMILMAVFTFSAVAQSDPPPYVQDPDPGTGGGGGCYTCEYGPDGFYVSCQPHRTVDMYWHPYGYGITNCVAHNAATGPNGCTYTSTCRYDYSSYLRDPSETIETLARLIGLDETSALLDEATLATLGQDPLTREAKVATMLAERLAVESRTRGYGEGYLVIPTRR